MLIVASVLRAGRVKGVCRASAPRRIASALVRKAQFVADLEAPKHEYGREKHQWSKLIDGPRSTVPDLSDGFMPASTNMSDSGGSDICTLPPMSCDGGNEVEFQRYWERNRNQLHLQDGWVERCSHPQVNMEPYWFNLKTGQITWQRPLAETLNCTHLNDSSKVLAGVGPAWDLSINELKYALATGDPQQLNLDYGELARRAVAEYESFSPRVLSWHDFQHITFWFFAGVKNRTAAKTKGGFFHGRGAGKNLFADPSFFKAAAHVISTRVHEMHPICLTYFVWTFTRAEVVIPSFMNLVGNYCCEGRLPMMDRCSLGTLVWNFAKQSIRHDRLFEGAASELARPNRVRSLAPRNFQNTLIAYGRVGYWNPHLFDALAAGMQRLLDCHDPPGPKLDRKLLFAYTCKDGSEVLADSFRISGLVVILRSLQRLEVTGSAIEACIASMSAYVQRCVRYSPRMMREPGDACGFALQLLLTSKDMPALRISSVIESLREDLATLCEGAPLKQKEQLQDAFKYWAAARENEV